MKPATPALELEPELELELPVALELARELACELAPDVVRELSCELAPEVTCELACELAPELVPDPLPVLESVAWLDPTLLPGAAHPAWLQVSSPLHTSPSQHGSPT
jgi:hypothetical protein